MIGQTISHYSIVEKLGEGGMGVVYKAEDTKLRRTVALKFLRSDVLEGGEHKERFLREAQAAAGLDHPNICTVHEIDEADGKTFLAMAFVEGRTVKDKIGERPLKLEEALDIAIQTAHGLQAAHERKIVHRDIKPANIMVNPQGQVKIMDFGLAQLADRTRLTQINTTLGTPSYMSPEQAQGLPGDRRTDIWSLGVMLYEMVTGRLPFAADREAAVLLAIIHEEPEPVTAIRAGLPLDLDRILRKALAKKPDERYQHIDEMSVDLKALGSSRATDTKGRRPSAPERTPSWKTITAALAATAVLAMLAGFILGRGRNSPVANTPGGVSPASVAMEITASPPLHLDTPTDYGFDVPVLDVSPDGSSIVFVGTAQGTTQLYLRRLGTFGVQPIPGTEGAIHPFFSPDGRSVAFLTHQNLKVVRPEGGSPVVLCDVFWPVRGKWLEDGSIYVIASMGLGLWRASEAGGTCTSVTPGKLRAHWYHEVLPGAKFVLATTQRGGRSFDHAEIQAVSMKGGQAKTLVANGYDPRFVPPGYLLFGRGSDLFAVRFDVDRMEARGPPRRVATGVRMNSLFPWVHAAASATSLAYVPGGDAAVGRLAWVDRQGQTEFLPMPEGVYNAFDVAGDGRIALHVCGARDYVQVYEPGKGETTRLQGRENYGNPRWSRRGDRIAVTTWGSGDGKWRAVVHGIHSGLQPKTILERDIDLFTASWTPDDGQVAIYDGLDSILLVPSSEALGTPHKISGEWDSDLAPRGQWLAFSRRGILVQSFDGARSYQVSPDVAFEPHWCRGCDQLFYRKGNQFFGVKVRFDPEFHWEQARLAFEAPGFVDTFAVSYAVSPDGKRLLAIKRVREMPRGKIHVVQNWQAAFEAAEASR